MTNKSNFVNTCPFPEDQQFDRYGRAGFRHVAWLILAAVGITLLVGACARDTVSTPPFSAPPCCGQGGDCMHASLNKDRDTDTRVYSFTMDENMTGTSLRLVVETRGGSLTWRLLDPNGQLRWEERVAYALSAEETREFEPIVGEWRLMMVTQDLRGGYDICWKGTRNPALAPPDSQEPASGICAQGEGDVVAVEINSDMPSPRCVKVTAEQRIEVRNRTQATIEVKLGFLSARVDAGGTHRFEQPVGELLAPGVHVLHASPFSGPEIWLVEP